MSGSIVGQVVNQQNGLPLEGAELNLTGEGTNQKAGSDRQGKYQFTSLAAGQYEMVASKDGFQNGIFGPLVVFDDISTEIRVALERQQS